MHKILSLSVSPELYQDRLEHAKLSGRTKFEVGTFTWGGFDLAEILDVRLVNTYKVEGLDGKPRDLEKIERFSINIKDIPALIEALSKYA